MKEFWIYTALRVVLFFASLGIVVGVWFLASGSVPLTWAVVIAFLMSGLGSFFLLNRQRVAFAQRVETRAARMTAKIEEMNAKEDALADELRAQEAEAATAAADGTRQKEDAGDA